MVNQTFDVLCPVADIQPSESNSGATFGVKPGLIFKRCGPNDAEKLRGQMIWLAELPASCAQVPSIQYGLWGPSRAFHASVDVGGDPAAVLLNPDSAKEIAGIVLDAVRWISEELHSRRSAPAPCFLRLVDQTKARLLKMRSSPALRNLSTAGSFKINSHTFPSVDEMLRVGAARALSEGWDSEETAHVHGDLHLGNIMLPVGGQPWYMIDPRGRFVGGTPFYDPYYDWGKLFHDLFCLYNLAVARGCRINVQDCTATVEVTNAPLRQAYATVRAQTSKWLGENGRDICHPKLMAYAGLLTLGALPFHLANNTRSLSLFCGGVTALYHGCNSSPAVCQQLLFGDYLNALA